MGAHFEPHRHANAYTKGAAERLAGWRPAGCQLAVSTTRLLIEHLSMVELSLSACIYVASSHAKPRRWIGAANFRSPSL